MMGLRGRLFLIVLIILIIIPFPSPELTGAVIKEFDYERLNVYQTAVQLVAVRQPTSAVSAL